MTTKTKIKIGDRVAWGNEIRHEGVVVASVPPGELPYTRKKNKFLSFHKWRLTDKVMAGVQKYSNERPDYSKLYNRRLVREGISYVVLTDENLLYWPRTDSLRIC